MKTTRSRIAARSGLAALLLCASAAAAERSIRIRPPVERVGKYEKIELRIDLQGAEGNPFDPDEVDLNVEVQAPGGKRLILPAFFCQEYERKPLGRDRRPADWMYPAGMPVWKARFAPMDLGPHRAAAVLKDRAGALSSGAVAFECVPSGKKGFLRVSRKDSRFLEFSEGQPFFPIGQNLAFIGESQHVNLSKAEEIFGKLAENGANYLRIWTCCEDWAMAVEARKSAWGRSWDWRPPIVPAPDGEGAAKGRRCLKVGAGGVLNVSPSHQVALRPLARYAVAGMVRTEAGAALRLEVNGARPEDPLASRPEGAWTAFRHEFETGPEQLWLSSMSFRLEGSGAAWIDGLSLQEAAGGPELLWEADANRRIRGFYNPLDCFLLDEVVAAAEKRGLLLQLCLITRDLYMDSLKDEKSPEYGQAIADAKKLLRYAAARWGYSTSVAAWEYFNEMNPGLPTDRFYSELGEHLERIDVHGHLRTTSAWGPSPKDCRHPKLDIADVHFYLRPSDKGRLRDEVEAVLDRARFLRESAPGKPAHLGEFGIANEKWQPTEEMKSSPELVDFHNALWASALSGTAGTALFWWWDRLDPRNAYPLYRPLSAFLADVPWTEAGLEPLLPAAARVSGADLRLVGLGGRGRAYLWLFDPRASWGSAVIEKKVPPEVRDASVELSGLAPGNCRARWWDTREGKVIREEDLAAGGGSIRLAVPPFRRDIACKVVLPIASGASAPEAPADLILRNGKIVTADVNFSVARTMAVRGDRIVAVGGEADVAPFRGAGTSVVDLGGKCVLPGLIDSHCHPSAAALEELDHPRPPMESVRDVLSYIESRAKAVPRGEWIFLGQRFLTRLREHRYPTREELDRAAPEHPVLFRTGPDCCVNSAALRAAGIGPDYKPPAGARAERDPATGTLTGVFRNMNQVFSKHIRSEPLPPDARREALRKLLGLYNSAGITGAGDRDVAGDDIAAYEDLIARNGLTVRISLAHHLEASEDPAEVEASLRRIESLPVAKNTSPFLRLKTVKLYLDGGMLTGSAFLSEPWGKSEIYGISDPEYRGLRFISEAALRTTVERAREHGFQVVAHCQGDAASDALLRAFEELDRKRPVRDLRMCIGHGSFQRLDIVRRAAAIGVVIDSQPAWLYLDASVLLRQFGKDRLRHFIPLRTWFAEGGVVAGGSDHMIGLDPDSSINPYNPFLGMWIALTRSARWVDGPVIPQEALTREQAIRLYTSNAAFIEFSEKEKGSLEPGKLADFIVLDRDILECPADEVKAIRPLRTYVGGKLVYENQH